MLPQMAEVERGSRKALGARPGRMKDAHRLSWHPQRVLTPSRRSAARSRRAGRFPCPRFQTIGCFLERKPDDVNPLSPDRLRLLLTCRRLNRRTLAIALRGVP